MSRRRDISKLHAGMNFRQMRRRGAFAAIGPIADGWRYRYRARSCATSLVATNSTREQNQ
jgi:hypothetical protein